MRAAILNEENLVINTVLSDAETAAQNGWILSETAAIGDTYDPETGEFTSPEPPPYIEPVPDAVSQRRARLALLHAGLLEQAQTIIDSLPEPQRTAALIEWEYATHISRHNDLVATLTPALGLSEEDVDNLFRAAAQIPD